VSAEHHAFGDSRGVNPGVGRGDKKHADEVSSFLGTLQKIHFVRRGEHGLERQTLARKEQFLSARRESSINSSSVSSNSGSARLMVRAVMARVYPQ
jgi:hypothetical protein